MPHISVELSFFRISINILSHLPFFSPAHVLPQLMVEVAFIALPHTHTQPSVQNSFFLRCSSGDDGGAWNDQWSVSNAAFVCVNCQFIQNRNNGSVHGGGGAIEYWSLVNKLGITNSLFSENHSNYRGGSVSMGTSQGVSLQSTLIQFCFFSMNSAHINLGNDVYFEGSFPSEPFLHCFSITPSNRVNPASNDDNWLPLGSICLILSTSCMQMILS